MAITKGPSIAGGFGKFGVSSKESRTLNGVVYDSKLEMNFHVELLKHFEAHEIQQQVVFELQPGFRNAWDGSWQRPIHYKADFVLGSVTVRADGTNSPGIGSLVLDAKGMILPQFRTACRLFEYQHRKPVFAVKRMKQLRELIEIYKKIKSMDTLLLSKLATGHTFTVNGYCYSDGSVQNITGRIIGREGYLALVRESLDRVAEAASALYALPEIRDTYDVEMRSEVYTKVKESLEKKLHPAAEDFTERTSKEVLHPVSPDIMRVDGEEEKIVLLRIDVESSTALGPPLKHANRKPATRLRALLEAQLPISRYVHRLNLYPGKYEDIVA